MTRWIWFIIAIGFGITYLIVTAPIEMRSVTGSISQVVGGTEKCGFGSASVYYIEFEEGRNYVCDACYQDCSIAVLAEQGDCLNITYVNIGFVTSRGWTTFEKCEVEE